MELTADVLTRVLAVCCGEELEEPVEALLYSRQCQPSFSPTLYAAWRNEGLPLNPALRYELDSQFERIERYRALAAVIDREVPGSTPFKGLEVAALYPADSTRHLNDLDYLADEPGLWRMCETLTGDGWDLHTATFLLLDGRLHVLACLRLPHADPFTLPYGVEVSTYVTLGDLAGVEPIVELPPRWREPAVKNLLMLLYERFEQPFRARDLVDSALLLPTVSDFAALWDEIDRLRLWPEYFELAALLERCELTAVPAAPRSRAVALARSRAGRARRRVTELRRPAGVTVRHLQRKLLFAGQSRVERRLWAFAGNRLDAGRALRAGLLCFGLPLPGVRPDVDTATVRERDGLTYVDTPSARFLLTAGEEVDEQDVEKLSDRAPGPAERPIGTRAPVG